MAKCCQSEHAAGVGVRGRGLLGVGPGDRKKGMKGAWTRRTRGRVGREKHEENGEEKASKLFCSPPLPYASFITGGDINRKMLKSHILHSGTEVDSLIGSANCVHMQRSQLWFQARGAQV